MQQPNIVFILSDDHGAWAMGCAGNPDVQTPNLDRLARAGLRFENCFCVTPVCSPARASILTGMIPSQHGVHDWIARGNNAQDGCERPIEYLEGLTTYTRVLADHGYVCGLSGKWHLGNAHEPQQGFTWWRAHAAGGGPYYNWPQAQGREIVRRPDYISDGITDEAIEFLETRDDRPFYLSVHYTAPHHPWERHHHPTETWDRYYQRNAFSHTPDLPLHPWQAKIGNVGHTPERRRELLSGYYTAITEMDRNIGRLLDWLEAHGQLANTLIVFTGDNGMNMGHHGLWGKGNASYPLNLYDTSVKVPLLIAGPGITPSAEPVPAMVSHYDLMPTLLEYAGLPIPDERARPGRSFAPLLRGQPFDGQDDVVVCDEYGMARMIRTRDWKYIHRHPDGPHEFYDLQADPDEHRNLIDDPAQTQRIAAFRDRLNEWFARYVDPRRDGIRHEVHGSGQYNRCDVDVTPLFGPVRERMQPQG